MLFPIIKPMMAPAIAAPTPPIAAPMIKPIPLKKSFKMHPLSELLEDGELCCLSSDVVLVGVALGRAVEVGVC